MSPKVLIIEDNADNLDLMVCLLGAAGFTVFSAVDGVDGLAAARCHRPDIIVCDLQMPRMDGRGVARALKADPAFRQVPLIGVTAAAMVGDREAVLRAGFDHYLSKPIEPELFAARVRAWLPVMCATSRSG